MQRIPIKTLRPEDLVARPLSEALTLPAAAYVEPDMHAVELRQIFAHSWQPVARASQLQQPGDQVVADVAGKPVLVVRGNDGELRGFFNVCKHRAGPLALANGNSRQLQCKYHGWTYTLEGQLRAAHEMQDAQDFDMSCIHLDPVNVAIWEGLVFVAVNTPVTTLDSLLQGIREQIRPIELSRMQYHSQVIYDVACNWKVYVDNYLEGYHLPHVHPGLNRLLNYRAYETILSDWYSYQHSPLDGTQGPYQSGEAHYYFIYPNIMLNILPDRLQTNLVLPVSARQCRVIFDFYYTETESGAAQKMIAEDLRFSDEVQQEDIGICERVQIGLESGAYQAGRLSPKRESGVHHFQELVRRAYSNAFA